MAEDEGDFRGTAVPSGRLGRMARFGGMTTSIAGSVLVDGARRVAKGERPSMEDLLLTPKNAAKVADQLSRLRGAAMKIGQLLSMADEQAIPKEFTEVFARLRSAGDMMPAKQLRQVLDKAWGEGWLRRFGRFDVRPMAAASIGQVHRAQTKDRQELAIKIQYPGVRESIDSDIDNVMSILNVSGLVPKGMDVKPLLEEAKVQLHQEADYEREAKYLKRFGELLAGSDDFVLPQVCDEFSTKDTLAMSLVRGQPIESLIDAPQEERDRVVSLLMQLVVREVFEFGLMQTDPNFGNYFYQTDSGRIVLLDFGATREVPAHITDGYRKLIQAGFDDDWEAVREAATVMGLVGDNAGSRHEETLAELFTLSMEPLVHEGPYDFTESDLAIRMRELGMTLRDDDFAHVPSPVMVFLHRKFGGTYLLATRLRARVDMRSMIEPHLTPSGRG
ncbi:MAG: AarF/ABC1/UbiB kinase family protein [Pseudomonadota bacterium]